jgi:hypothetical protein
MPPITWFYTWTSKDEVFHHILKSCLDSSPEHFTIHPLQIQETEDRFAIAAKFLEEQPENAHIIISDANFIADHITKLYEYLQTFIEYDIVTMKESDPNILFVRNTQKVCNYIKNISTSPTSEDLNSTTFQAQTFCNSKFHLLEIMKSFVLNLISFEKDQKEALYDKLNVASGLVDITPLEPLIPYDIWNRLVDAHKEANTELPIMYFNYKSKPWYCEPTLKD